MKNLEEKLLVLLIEKFRSSKKDRGDNLIQRRTAVKPEKIYQFYRDNVKGDFDKIRAVNKVAEELQKRGWITAEKRDFSDELEIIYLCDTHLHEIEIYLENEYGYVPKDAKLQQLEALLGRYAQTTPLCRMECQKLRSQLDKRKLPANLNELEDLFKTLVFLENNVRALYFRELSMELFGDSKYFEKNVLKRICGILHKYNPAEQDEGILDDEILENYHVFKEPQTIRMQGNFWLKIKGKIVDCSVFTGGIEFTAEDLQGLERVSVEAKSFLTVENLTSFLRYRAKDAVTFYLGGYANRFQRDFLKKVYADNPFVQYLHFGDIDAGGLWILDHLRRVTGISFAPYHMAVEDLQNPQFQNCLHSLTEEDRHRLENLRSKQEFSTLVNYMLVHNVKLEQEIISYSLKKRE